MRTHPLPVCLLILAATFSGCASSFVVKSDPPVADIFILDPKTGEKKPLGKTPLDMKTGAVKDAVGGAVLSGQYFTVLVESKGYLSEKYLVPTTRFGTLVTELDVKLKPGTQEKEARVAKEILDHLFLAQKLAISREYERAQGEIDRILADFPDFPRALSMRASIYYMQRNYPESLKWYEQALRADPQMEDAIRMTARIHAIQSGGAPSGASVRATASSGSDASANTAPATEPATP